MLSRLLFEAPWWLPTVSIGVGIFVWLTGNRRQEKQVMWTGLGIILLGVAVMGISLGVDTDRELAEKHTRRLVAAVGQHDWQTFESLLSPQTSIYGVRGPQVITQAVKSAADRFNVSSARITGLDIEQADTLITVSIRVLSEQLRGSVGASDWQLQYQNFGQGFVLYNVRAQGNQQVNEDVIRAQIARFLAQ